MGYTIGGCFITAEDDCGNDVLDEGEMCDCGLNFDPVTMLCNEDPCCNGTSCKIANEVECRFVIKLGFCNIKLICDL